MGQLDIRVFDDLRPVRNVAPDSIAKFRRRAAHRHGSDLLKRATIFGSIRTLLIALLSWEVISTAVPRFAAKPIQSAVTRSGKPASTTEEHP
ncbi:hypothetical protein ACFQX9_16475 [Bradyrhizobium sp. GCM10028915]|uniref:hypothetical protein n=1 Tax=Bradyrhizobium sp. GCM10028915 TaxID=3273385 RepID=UPI003616E733